MVKHSQKIFELKFELLVFCLYMPEKQCPFRKVKVIPHLKHFWRLSGCVFPLVCLSISLSAHSLFLEKVAPIVTKFEGEVGPGTHTYGELYRCTMNLKGVSIYQKLGHRIIFNRKLWKKLWWSMQMVSKRRNTLRYNTCANKVNNTILLYFVNLLRSPLKFILDP